MVMDEFPMILASHGLDTSRMGLIGRSMGGYGALHIGGLSGSSRFRAVIAESPAIWKIAGAALPHASIAPLTLRLTRSLVVSTSSMEPPCWSIAALAMASTQIRRTTHPDLRHDQPAVSSRVVTTTTTGDASRRPNWRLQLSTSVRTRVLL
jgi:predicted alpha/beta superfamily hydrolase